MKNATASMDSVTFLYCKSVQEMEYLDDFAKKNGLEKIDEIDSQLRELLKIRNPQLKCSDPEWDEKVLLYLNGQDKQSYGVWVYYPWLNSIIHLLDEDEYIEVRTSRNKLKITHEEQLILRKKKIGIIGMSVGQASAITLAMESVCGEIRIADFDNIELSNMNRIRSSVKNIGVAKVSICKRAIAEIDPFLKVTSFPQGIDDSNIDDFLEKDGKLDLLVEECDSIDVKLLSRFRARQHQIPVIMETSDRGMLDIERFDLEPELPILNGRLEGLEEKSLSDLTNEQKKALIMNIIDPENVSERGMASLAEVGKTLCSWPQLMSDVTLGASIVCTTARKILLGHDVYSGRHYVDLNGIIENENIIRVSNEI